jgi:hypothetical protein
MAKISGDTTQRQDPPKGSAPRGLQDDIIIRKTGASFVLTLRHHIATTVSQQRLSPLDYEPYVGFETTARDGES